MIKLFFYSLLAIIVGLISTVLLAGDPGYLLVSIADFTFETSLFALFVASIAVLIILRIGFILLEWLNPLRLFRAGKGWTFSRIEKRAADACFEHDERHGAYLQELECELLKGADEAQPLPQLKKAWKVRTKNISKDPILIAAYVDVLEKHGAISDAIKLLEVELESTWSDLLLRRYSLLALRAGDTVAAQQMQTAEQWLKNRTKDAPLLLALGRLSLRNKLWGKARDYFENSLKEQADVEAFAELARLLKNLKEPESSANYLDKYTSLISKRLPDYPQPS